MGWKTSLIILLCSVIPLAGCNVMSDVATSTRAVGKAEVLKITFPSRPGAINVLFDVAVKAIGAQAGTSYFLCLLSRNDYFFGQEGVGWSEEDLKGADANERDYSKIQAAEKRKIKQVRLGAPAIDKDIVALKNEIASLEEKVAERYARELQSNLKGGDLVEFLKNLGKDISPSRQELNQAQVKQ